MFLTWAPPNCEPLPAWQIFLLCSPTPRPFILYYLWLLGTQTAELRAALRLAELKMFTFQTFAEKVADILSGDGFILTCFLLYNIYSL